MDTALVLARVLKDTATAFPLQISTHVASSNPWEATKQTHFLDVQHRSFNKQPRRVPPLTARVEQQKPTPQNELNACLSLQGTGFQAVAGLEKSGMAPNSLLLVVMNPRGPKHLHMLSWEGRRQKNTGKEAALLGYIA